MGPDSNPVLDELDGLSPQAKSALSLAHTRIAGARPSLLASAGTGATGGAAAPAMGNAGPNVPAAEPSPAQIPVPPLPAAPGFRQPGAHPFQTALSAPDEQQFQSWVQANRRSIPVVGNWQDTPQSDYDMRGYWNEDRGKLGGTQMRSDNLHLPDTYKTPFHRSASNQSIYMPSDAPHWNPEETQLIANDGKVAFNEPSTAAAPALRAIATPGASKIAPLGPPSNLADDKAELTRLTSTGSGISQIQNPWARVPLQIADALGGAFFPGVMRNIPGSQIHHNELVNQRASDVTRDETLESDAAKNALEGAQTTEAEARGREADANSEHLRNPQDEFSTVSTTGGYDVFSKKHGTAAPLMVNGEQAQPVEKFTAPHYETLQDGSVLSLTTDPKTGVATPHIVFKGDPKVETELTKLEIGGKPHSVIVDKKTGNTIKDLGETGEKPPTVNVNAGTAALDRETTHFGKGWEAANTAANAQLEKIREARDMVNGNAESQALGVPKVMTAVVSGQGSGVRITQAELNMIAHARGIQGDFEGWISKISGKGALTPTQKQELTSVLDAVQERILQKQKIANDALDSINGGRSRDEIIGADKAARQKLAEFERGGGGGQQAASDLITVQIPGQKPGQIHASQKDAFLKKYPNAKVQ